MAGVPVYSQAGRGGGWSLVGGARTDLSGLTAAEARALFLLAGPSSQATPPVKAALRKLVRALPETLRGQAEAAASAVVIDPSSWDRASRAQPEHLSALQQAIVDGVQVRIRYAGRGRSSERVVHPLGLVVKGSLWYLVAWTDAGQRTFRVDRVVEAHPIGEPVHRPEGFDLAEAWKSVVASVDEWRAPYEAIVHIDPDAVEWLRRAWGTRAHTGRRVRGGRVEVRLRGYAAAQVAAELAGFGSRLEVISPDEVRDELARIARELVAQYA